MAMMHSESLDSSTRERLPRTSPLHKWLADELRRQIVDRQLQPGESLKPELELCDDYDVSRGTVRQALATLSREGLIERHPGRGSFVRQVASRSKPTERSGLNASLAAAARVYQFRVLVDAVSPTVDNFILNQTMEGLNLAASRFGGCCKLSYEFHRFEREDDPAGPAFLAQNDCDGFVVLPYTRYCMSFLTRTPRPSKPLATLYRHIDNEHIYRFAVDNEEGAFAATDYLLRLGHQRIALLLTSWDYSMPSTLERLEGYRRAMAQVGGVDGSLIATTATWHPGEVKPACARLFSQPDRPTALLISGMAMAAPALEAVEEFGLVIPDDLSVLAFDESDTARLHEPPISIVRMPLVENGRKALERMMAAIASDQPPAEEVTTVPELLIRRSCRALTPPQGQRD